MTKFNLSDKIEGVPEYEIDRYENVEFNNGVKILRIEDVKEFIKLLKLEIDKEKIIENFMVSKKEIFAIVDKLSGEDLLEK